MRKSDIVKEITENVDIPADKAGKIVNLVFE